MHPDHPPTPLADATPALDVTALRARAEAAERLLAQSEARTAGYFEAYHKLDIERARLAEEVELLRCDGIAAAMLRGDRDIARSERDAATAAASAATVRAEGALRLLAELYSVAALRVPHIFAGACPNEQNEPGTGDDRDNLCPACAILLSVEAALRDAGLPVPGEAEPLAGACSTCGGSGAVPGSGGRYPCSACYGPTVAGEGGS